MSDKAETIRVQPWGKGQGDFVEIDRASFDPAVHALYADPLDHDGDGKKGGSKKPKATPAADSETGA